MSNNVFVPYPIGSVVITRYFDVFRVAAHVTRKIGGRTCHGLVLENTPGTADALQIPKCWVSKSDVVAGELPAEFVWRSVDRHAHLTPIQNVEYNVHLDLHLLTWPYGWAAVSVDEGDPSVGLPSTDTPVWAFEPEEELLDADWYDQNVMPFLTKFWWVVNFLERIRQQDNFRG